MTLSVLFTDSLFGKGPPGHYAGVNSEELGMTEILGYRTFILKTRGMGIWLMFKKRKREKEMDFSMNSSPESWPFSPSKAVQNL